MPMAKPCPVTGRPMTSFRFKPGDDARYKNTVISKEAALLKNVCQVCLYDLDYQLPAGVVDAMRAGEGEKDKLDAAPTTEANKEFYYNRVIEEQAKAREAGGGLMTGAGGGGLVAGGGAAGAIAAAGSAGAGGGGGGKVSKEAVGLMRLAQARNKSAPYYRRNKSKVCTFWLCSRCDRVLRQDCPYRPCNGDFDFPELDRTPELKAKAFKWLKEEGVVAVMTRDDDEIKEVRKAISGRVGGNIDDSIKRRYYGKGDEATDSILQRTKERMDPPLTPPEDKSITTLFVGGVAHEVTEGDLRAAFGEHGDLEGVRVVPEKKCAFVTFALRAGAEAAAEALHNRLAVKGFALRIAWGKPRAGGAPRGGMGAMMPPPMGVRPPGAMPPPFMPPPAGMPPPPLAPPAAGAAAAPGGWVLPPPAGPPPAGMPPPAIAAMPPPVGPPPALYPSMDPAAVGTAPAAPIAPPKQVPR
eukprot:PRCOL_00007001-RA